MMAQESGGPQVVDLGYDIVASSPEERGLHFLDPQSFGWESPAVRPAVTSSSGLHTVGPPAPCPIGIGKKLLMSPRSGEDRFPISLVCFPPRHRVGRHWHTQGSFLHVRRGSVSVSGLPLGPGAMAYIDAKVVYDLQSGQAGCEFLLLRRARAETQWVTGDSPCPPDVVDREEIAAVTRAERGLHLHDLEAIPWTPTVVRPIRGRAPLLPEDDRRPVVEGELWEKALVYPLPGEDRFPVTIIRFPPHFTFARHWHTDGEFVMILSGTANFAGRHLGTGDMAYNDARTVYGAESAGPRGCDFLLVRRAWAETNIVT